MTSGNKDLAKLIRLIADVAESENDELIAAVYSSARSARAEFSKRRKLPVEAPERPPAISEDELRRLEQFESRQELSVHLKELFPRKSDVDAVARALKISLSKNFSYDDAVEKIIDASIGYKIRSRAIRGE
ncbi:hypothetical protein [Rhizobium sp. Leaf341]|uniref:hypothetical protein n=1 Tax=Rhizobium sp. Leaf341 TaxID=1736344 RepID=UPI0012E3ABA3|nr:hypothetical protein [Rhizobium sp. Leaf341]